MILLLRLSLPKTIMKFNSLAIVILLLISSCKPTIQDNDTKYKPNLKSKIDSLVGNEFNGIILVTKGENVVYSKAFGYADFEEKTPLQLKDQFVIGSISKQITAVLVLREYEKGSIYLDDTIDKYLPSINHSWASKVTIHHLLTHTHGITSIDQELSFEPETQFQYSQLGYELLAQIIETVTQKTFLQLSTELFNVFEFQNTFHPSNTSYKNLVKGYEENEEGALILSSNSLENYPAAGSFISNVYDLARWNMLLHNHILVKKETLEMMKKRYATRTHPIFKTIEYGYGLLFKKEENNIEIGALGYAPGFASALYYYPKSQMSLIVLENTAKNLHDFRLTFRTHTTLMKTIKINQITDY